MTRNQFLITCLLVYLLCWHL